MSKAYSIKCPKCAAPLTLLGGGRVQTITCSYCKSVIDLNDNYRILSIFKNASRPDTPFSIGMKGKLKGAEYTIIGVVSYKTTEYPIEFWHEYLLFSPLYGYVWLTFEKGNLIFSRRTRNFPPMLWSEIALRSDIEVSEQKYKFYSSYDATIDFVEGELTWIAKKGDRSSFIDLIAPPYGISVEKNKQEVEHYQSEYLDAEEVYQAFEIPKEKQHQSNSFNPLKPFSKPLLETFSRIAILVLIIIGFVLVGLHYDGKGNDLLAFKATNNQTTQRDFTVKETKYLTSIELSASKPSELNNFSLQLSKDGERLFTLDKNSGAIWTSLSQGQRLDSWEYNTKKAIAYIKLDKKGVYQLKVTPINTKLTSNMNITVKEGVSRSYYFIYLSLFIFAVLLVYLLSYLRYKHKLSENSDNEMESFSISSESFFWIFFIIIFIFIFIGGV